MADALVLVALFFLLVLPALANGYVILFPDSVGYFHAGESAVTGVIEKLAPTPPKAAASDLAGPSLAKRAKDDISTARSVYYGAGFYAAVRLAGVWALPAVQALVAMVSLFIAVPWLVGSRRRATAAIIAGLATLGGLAIFSSTAMPDLFTGLMLLGMAILFCGRPALPLAQRLWWLAMVLAAALFHKSNLATGVVMAGLYLVAVPVWRLPLQRLLAPAAMLGLALFGHLAVDKAVQRMTGRTPAATPFLVSRLVADGTASLWLARHCNDPEPLQLCKWRDRFPMHESYFLWSNDPERGLIKIATLAERDRINAEANTLVFGTISEFPLTQLRISLANFAEQFVTVGVTQFGVRPPARTDASPAVQPMLEQWPHTSIGRGVFPLATISGVMLVAYLAGLGVLLVAAVRVPRRSEPDFVARQAAIAWLMTGVITNAAVLGMIAGIYDRYQGRVVWMVLLAAVMSVAMWRDNATPGGGTRTAD